MRVRIIWKTSLVLLASCFMSTAVWGAGWFDLGKTFTDNGKKALQDGHYLDAVGWFERAEKLATKDPRLDAGLLEMIGYSCMRAKDYSKAVWNLELANQKYEMLVPFNPECARLYDCLAEIRIEMKDYAIAESFLLEAYDRTMGQDPKNVADPRHVGERAERLARICSLEGGLSPSGQYKGTRNRGKSSDDMFAYAVSDLLERERKSGVSQPKIQEALKDVFGRWKKLIDIGGSASNLANYNNSWEKAYGSKTATIGSGGAIGSGGSGSGSSGIFIWSPKTNIGSGTGQVFPWAPKTALEPGLSSGGSGGTGTAGHINLSPFQAGSGIGGSGQPNTVKHILPSPFKTESAERSSFPVKESSESSSSAGESKMDSGYVSGETEAIESLDETLKHLGL